MKLNGWKRIGIVISVVWFLGAYTYKMREKLKTVDDRAYDQYVLCLKVINNLDQCNAGFEADKTKDRHEMEKDVPMSVALPIPVGWILAYVGLFSTRWVKRGFAAPRH
jgi:hypothetical protein